MMTEVDLRKQFILSTTVNYFGYPSLPYNEDLRSDKCLSNFLEDIGCFILTAKKIRKSDISLQNKLPPGDGNETVLVFFKTRPEVVTDENISRIVFVASMPDSPITALYYTILRIFAPTLLKDEKWCQDIEPKVQSMLTDLETSLRRMVLKAEDEMISPSANLTEIMSVEDELHFWTSYADHTKKKSDHDKARAFIEVLSLLVSALRQLETIEVLDAEDCLETAHIAIDDLWKLDEYRYPQERMTHLMEIIGKIVTRFIQKKINSDIVWEGEFIEVEALLNQCLTVCNKWIQTCEKLTTLFWPNHSLHRWTGLPYMPVHIRKFEMRLKEVLKIRTIDRQLTKLLSPNERAQLDTASNFKPFSGVNTVQYNPYTEPVWQAAVNQFEQKIQPAEERVAAKLKHQLRNANLNTLQLMQEFEKYQEVIQRPSILRVLVAEREMLLSQLQDYVANVQIEAPESHMRLVDLPILVARLCWVRQLEAKILEIEKISDAVLSDLGSYAVLIRAVDNVKKELKYYHTEQFDSWTRETGNAIKSRTLGLKTDEPVVHFEQGKLMRVNFNPALPGLIQQVRQIAMMGYNIPLHIQDEAELAKQFMKQARALQQVATFHNTIGDRMIASQRPMMLAAALELAKLVREQHNVTWSNTNAVDSYITKLQASVDRLYKENNQLAHYHNQIADKVVNLMSTDLLRHQPLWKDSLREIRELMAHVETQFSNTKSWRVHWDHQIYKALEHQYQLGLEALNQNMPEIKVDIVYRQQRLQLNPPLEELRLKYYGQLKRFMGLPLSFRGVCDTSIFPAIVDGNAHRFGRVFRRVEDLFAQLCLACTEWEDSVALGSVDLDTLCRQHLSTAADWDVNFRASKAWSQEIAKLVTSERKIDCFTINVGPVCNEIELHNRKYWDTLASLLYLSIQSDLATIDKFIQEGRRSLQLQPQHPDELREINFQYLTITQKAEKMQEVMSELQNKNKTLASWTKEKVEQVSTMIANWDNFQIQLSNQQYVIGKQVETMKNNLISSVDLVSDDLERFVLCWEQFKPKEDSLSTTESLQNGLDVIRTKREEWQNLMTVVNKLRDDHGQFQMTPPEFPQCKQIEEDLKHYEDTWDLYENFNNDLTMMSKEEWIVVRNKSQMKLLKFVDDWTDKLNETTTTAVTVRLLQELEKYRELAPALKFVRGETFSEKHWVEMFNIINATFKPVDMLTFGDFLEVKENIKNSVESLQDLNTRAASEIVILQALAELDMWEVEARFSVTNHLDSKGNTIQLIKHFNDIMTKVGDNQCLLQSIKSSPNYRNFEDRASIWETRLSDLDNVLRNLNQIQRKWVYLEPIFGGGTLKMERGRFERVDRDLRMILGDLANANFKVISLCRIPHLQNTLLMLLQQLSHCQKSLLEYLEEKRLRFPRFYFLGDEDLLEILGQSSKQHVIQSHLKKLFSGIHSVVFRDNYIIAMQSLEGETVELSNTVEVTQDIEEWLSCLSKEMKSTLKKLVRKCVENPDPSKFPSQVLCLAERVSFTSHCEKSIKSASLKKLLVSLKSQLELYTRYHMESSQKDKDSIVLELKLKALQLEIIYHISVVEQLLESEVTNVEDWHWQRRLRFYLEENDLVTVRMVDAEFTYSYEYQGNAAKLVHTPLTDKCYLTLTQAMSMGLGGNPYGPAGTGKTESVKALGALLGRQVLVFNCDEGIDVQSLTRILVGLVKCGAWGCFDEFNRLEEATLSAISMQIHPIQEALRNAAPLVKLLGQEVTVDSNTGIFVTLNPAGQGYAGRQKLPDNLKQLFRPVVMSRPDDSLIAQVVLHCEGFKHASTIGHKLVTLFDLSRKLLSKQKHYDWGLRALKTVVGACGSARKDAKTANVTVDSEEREMAVAVKALRLNTLSKLTTEDCVKFDSLVQDMFPGVTFESNVNNQLAVALQQSFSEMHLIHNHQQELKCMELYEQIRQRMGVVVVGPSGSGKSTLIKVLKSALGKIGVAVTQHTINAKALTHTQLLGSIDLDTRQWVDGVLSATAQVVYSQPKHIESWIVFDGDVDPEWIESLNSVLDDNRLLTLPSGWRIQFGPNVHFLFETHDLSHASPATISRMGMILLSSSDVNNKDIVEAWLLSQSTDVASILSQYIAEYFYQAVEWVTSQGQMALVTSPVSVIQSGLSHMSGVVTRAQFTVALVNGLAANLTDHSRQLFIKQVVELTGEYLPSAASLDCLRYDTRRDCVDLYDSRGLADSHNIVLTPQVCSAVDVISLWLLNQHSFLIIGPHGCGKSLLLNYCFSKLRNVEVATIHCSAQISPQHVLQKLSQLCMVVSSSSGRVYRPSHAHHLILHLKNINLVTPDKWGTNVLTAWLQQVLTCGGFYDTDLEWVGLENVQFVFSLSSSDFINPRFLAKNYVYSLSCPEKSELKYIFGELIKSFLPNKKTKKIATVLSNTVVNIYLEAVDRLSNVSYSHYLFTPDDITSWCKGLLRYPLTDNQCLIEALLYEASRQLGDKLVTAEEKQTLSKIFSSVLEKEFNIHVGTDPLKDMLFISELPGSLDSPMVQVSVADCTALVERTLNQLGESEVLVTRELVELVAKTERVLSSSSGSLLLIGRAGVGRKTAVQVVAARHRANILSFNLTHTYNFTNFKNDLKHAMQVSGVEGEQVYLILEDYQLILPEFLDLINSLLSSGEVPGLYQTEELEAITAVLRETATQTNFEGNMYQYFASRVQRNLHVVLILESTHEKLSSYCQNNPAILKNCTGIWIDTWSDETMLSIPRILISRIKGPKSEDSLNIIKLFKYIHNNSSQVSECSPRRFKSFIKTYLHIYQSRISIISETQSKLQAGVSKLTAARQMVDTLKLEAAEQGTLLAEKQAKATAALEMITETMSNANAHRGDMDQLKMQTEKENRILQIRKKEIETELAEIEPLIEEAKAAVGNIKTESLSEIRSLRAPPEVIRDILEGVLRLMGIQDTSWNSMKTFLAKRGVKEDIRCFDARNITADNRESVELLLSERRDSFNAKTAKRASQAAAPLAAWVTANVKFSHILEKIKPLEREQANLHRNLKLAEERIEQLSSGLQDVDKTVAELKDRLNRFTREAAEIEIHLSQAQNTICSAQNLVHKLDFEYSRWQQQLRELSESLSVLTHNCVLAAAFITYLPTASQDVRRMKVYEWCQQVGVQQFSLIQFLSTERQQLMWQSQGLPSDQLSIENAIIITNSCQQVYILDPSSLTVNWLKNSLTEDNVEVVSHSSPRFHTNFDLAVRFGKKMIVQDVDRIEPSVYPVLRGETNQQDGRSGLKLYHFSRSGSPLTEPHVAALLCQVNFTTTLSGLTQQLVQAALKQEKPQLEVRRGELLRREEELKMSLHQLQENVLQELANAAGDILQNKELLASLNETKRSSSAISESLEESAALKAALISECNMYQGVAEFGSRMFFAIMDLARLNTMYQLSIPAFLPLFQRTVKTPAQDEMGWKQTLLQNVYLYMSRSLYKDDTMAFALHLAHSMCPTLFQPNEWELFTGQAVICKADPGQTTKSVPSWVPADCVSSVYNLQNILPQLELELDAWKTFPQSEPPVKISSFQRVLLIQAIQPDLLYSTLTKFVLQALGLTALSPPPLRLNQILHETSATMPVLMLCGSGTDPSMELSVLAASSKTTYLEVALGEGQETMVSDMLHQAASAGHWLCLKNLHLMTSWLPTLEKQLQLLTPHKQFRLWLTSEPHPQFPTMLILACLKVTYEAPRGVKRNLLRSYCSWETQVDVPKPQFALAWFHAIVQERRTYIPQGWVKLYEFNDTDLNAALHVLKQRLKRDGRQVRWEFVRGLGELAIYGGRVDNAYDLRVLYAYLQAYFNTSVFSDNSPLAPGVYVPQSNSLQDHKKVIEQLPDQDSPSFFGLPANIDRSWQRNTSSSVINKLKVLACCVDSQSGQDHLTTILNLWKKLNQGTGYIKMKVVGVLSDLSPLASFLAQEFEFGVNLVQAVHQSLSSVTRVIKGTTSPSSATLQLINHLIRGKTPDAWLDLWIGPSSPHHYLQSLIVRVKSLANLRENFTRHIDLAQLFHPDIFFSAFRQQASREKGVAIDELEQHCVWGAVSEQQGIVLEGLQLEGASLTGDTLIANSIESPHVTTSPPLTIFWTKMTKETGDAKNKLALPLYLTADREVLIIELKIPCRSTEHNKWILAGTALYIHD